MQIAPCCISIRSRLLLNPSIYIPIYILYSAGIKQVLYEAFIKSFQHLYIYCTVVTFSTCSLPAIYSIRRRNSYRRYIIYTQSHSAATSYGIYSHLSLILTSIEITLLFVYYNNQNMNINISR